MGMKLRETFQLEVKNEINMPAFYGEANEGGKLDVDVDLSEHYDLRI